MLSAQTRVLQVAQKGVVAAMHSASACGFSGDEDEGGPDKWGPLVSDPKKHDAVSQVHMDGLDYFDQNGRSR